MDLSKQKVIIFDRQAITQTGMEWLVKQIIPYSVIQHVETKDELINNLTAHPNSLVILDYTLSDINSADALLNISACFLKAHWILFSEALSVLFLKRIVVPNELFSVVLKTSDLKEIKAAIKLGEQKKQFICQLITDQLLNSDKSGNNTKEPLTLTECEILKEIALGKTAKEVASMRHLSVHTVITHRKNIYRKLDINNAQELTRYAMRAGLINAVDYQI